MDIFEYIIYIVVGLVVVYSLFRLLSIAIFKSWFDMKLKNKERRKNDENHGIDGQDGSIGK